MSTVFASITTPGPPGPPGRTGLWLTGTVPPVTAQGQDGDMYLNSATGDVYGPKTSSVWGGIVANIKGPTGATGATGYSPVYIVAAGVPAPATGNNGDMYINSTTSDLYGPKTAGAWGSIKANLKGNTGNTGAQGPPGVAYTPRGAWSSATTYAQGDMVSDANVAYISLQSGNVNHVPLSNPAWWQAVASGGSQTPWNTDIDAAGFKLNNTSAIGIGAVSNAVPLSVYSASQDPSLTAKSGSALLSGTSGVSLSMGVGTTYNAAWLQGKFLADGDGRNFPILLNPLGGNVGVGTVTNPLGVLHCDAYQKWAIFGSNVASTIPPNVPGIFAGWNYGAGTGEANLAYNSSSVFVLADATGGSWKERLRILSSGLWGIGTNPDHVFHLKWPTAVGTTVNSSVDMVRLQVDASGVGQDDNIRIRNVRFAAGADWTTEEWRIQRQVQTSPMGYITFNNQDVAFGSISTEVMRVTANFRVGIGTNAPQARLTVSGTGQSAATFDPINGALGGTAQVDDVGGAAGSGGAVLFSANSSLWRVAAIKAYITDGTANATGDLIFLTRTVTSDTVLSEKMRITGGGGSIGILNPTPRDTVDIIGTLRLGTTALPGDGFQLSDVNGVFGLKYMTGISVFMNILSATYDGKVSIGVAGGNNLLSVIAPSNPTAASASTQVCIGEATNNTAYRLTMGYFLDGGNYRGTIQSTANGPAAGTLYLQPQGGKVAVGLATGDARGIVGINPPAYPTTIAGANSIMLGEPTNSAGYGMAMGFPLIGDWVGSIQVTKGGTPCPLILNGLGGGVAVGKTAAGYALDVSGDCNISGTFRVNGTPLATGGGSFTTQTNQFGSRALGTNYQNTSGKVMFLAVMVIITVGNNVVAFADAASNPSTQVGGAAWTAGGGSATVCFMVLPGNFYRLAGAVTISSWVEWT
jgi:hypothetical protein